MAIRFFIGPGRMTTTNRPLRSCTVCCQMRGRDWKMTTSFIRSPSALPSAAASRMARASAFKYLSWRPSESLRPSANLAVMSPPASKNLSSTSFERELFARGICLRSQFVLPLVRKRIIHRRNLLQNSRAGHCRTLHPGEGLGVGRRGVRVGPRGLAAPTVQGWGAALRARGSGWPIWWSRGRGCWGRTRPRCIALCGVVRGGAAARGWGCLRGWPSCAAGRARAAGLGGAHARDLPAPGHRGAPGLDAAAQRQGTARRTRPGAWRTGAARNSPACSRAACGWRTALSWQRCLPAMCAQLGAGSISGGGPRKARRRRARAAGPGDLAPRRGA